MVYCHKLKLHILTRQVCASWLTVLVLCHRGSMKWRKTSKSGAITYMLPTAIWSYKWHLYATLIMISLKTLESLGLISQRKYKFIAQWSVQQGLIDSKPLVMIMVLCTADSSTFAIEKQPGQKPHDVFKLATGKEQQHKGGSLAVARVPKFAVGWCQSAYFTHLSFLYSSVIYRNFTSLWIE